MLLRMPMAILLGALLGALLPAIQLRLPTTMKRRFISIAPTIAANLSMAALILASLVMPFWMLPVMMDRAEVAPMYAAARDLSLFFTGFLTTICAAYWAPVLRHLLVLEQVAMLLRYAVWYGFAPVPLCAAWDADAQTTVGLGLASGALLLSVGYVFFCWQQRDAMPTLQADT